jgi:hypothetical protein
MAEEVEMLGMVDMRVMVDPEVTRQFMALEITAAATEMMMIVIIPRMVEMVDAEETQLVDVAEMVTTVQTKPLSA